MGCTTSAPIKEPSPSSSPTSKPVATKDLGNQNGTVSAVAGRESVDVGRKSSNSNIHSSNAESTTINSTRHNSTTTAPNGTTGPNNINNNNPAAAVGSPVLAQQALVQSPSVRTANTPAVVPRLDERTKKIYDEKTPQLYAQTFRDYPTDFFEHYLVKYDGIFTMQELSKVITDCYTLLVRDLKEITWRETNKIDIKKEREKLEKMTQLQRKQALQKQSQDINSTTLDVEQLLHFMPYPTAEDNIQAISRFLMHKLGSDGFITKNSFSTGWELYYDALFDVKPYTKKSIISSATASATAKKDAATALEAFLTRRRLLNSTITSIASSTPPQVSRRVLLAYSTDTYVDDGLFSCFDSNLAKTLKTEPYKIISPAVSFTALELVWQYYAGGSQRIPSSTLMIIARDIIFSVLAEIKLHCESLLLEAAQNLPPSSGSAQGTPLLSPALSPNRSEPMDNFMISAPSRMNNSNSSNIGSGRYESFTVPVNNVNPLQRDNPQSAALLPENIGLVETFGTSVKLSQLIARNKPLYLLAYKTLQNTIAAQLTQSNQSPPQITAQGSVANVAGNKMRRVAGKNDKNNSSTKNVNVIDNTDDDPQLRSSFLAGRQSNAAQPNLQSGGVYGPQDPLFTLPAIFHQYVENILPFYFDQSDQNLYVLDDATLFTKIPSKLQFNTKGGPIPLHLDTLCQDQDILTPPSGSLLNETNSATERDPQYDHIFSRYTSMAQRFYSKGQIPSPSKTILNKIFLYLNFHLDHGRTGSVAKQSFLKYFVPSYCRLFDYQQTFSSFNTHSFYSPSPILSTSTESMSGNYGAISTQEKKYYWNTYTIFSSIDQINYAKWAATCNSDALRLRGNISNNSGDEKDPGSPVSVNNNAFNNKSSSINSSGSPNPDRFESGITVDIISRTTFRGGSAPLLSPETNSPSPSLHNTAAGVQNPNDNMTVENFNVIDIWNLPLLQPYYRPLLPDLVTAGSLTEADLNALQLALKSEREKKAQLRKTKEKLTVSSSMSSKDKASIAPSSAPDINDDDGDSDRESLGFDMAGDRTLVTYRHVQILKPSVDVLNFYATLAQSYSMLNQAIESSAPDSPIHNAPVSAVPVAITTKDGLTPGKLSNNNSQSSTGNSGLPPPPPSSLNSPIFAKKAGTLPRGFSTSQPPQHAAASLTRAQNQAFLSLNVTALQTPLTIPIQTVHLTISNILMDAIKHRCRTIDYFVNPANTQPAQAQANSTALTLPSLVTFYHNNRRLQQQQQPLVITPLLTNNSSHSTSSSDIHQQPSSPGSYQDDRDSLRSSISSRSSFRSSSTFGFLRSSINHQDPLSPGTSRGCGHIDMNGNFTPTNPLQTQIEVALDKERLRRLTWLSLSTLTEGDLTSFPTLTSYRVALDQKASEKGSFRQLKLASPPSAARQLSSSANTKPIDPTKIKVGKGLGVSSDPRVKTKVAAPPPIPSHLYSPEAEKRSLSPTGSSTQDQLSIRAAFRRGSLLEADNTDMEYTPKKRYSMSASQQPATGAIAEPLVVSTSNNDLASILKAAGRTSSPRNDSTVQPTTPTSANVGSSSTISGGLRGSGVKPRPQPRQRDNASRDKR